MSQSFHMHARVQTFLDMSAINFYKNWYGAVTDDNGRSLSYQEMKKALQEELDKGHVVIPCGPCNNFDYSGHGCLGHETEEGKK